MSYILYPFPQKLVVSCKMCSQKSKGKKPVTQRKEKHRDNVLLPPVSAMNQIKLTYFAPIFLINKRFTFMNRLCHEVFLKIFLGKFLIHPWMALNGHNYFQITIFNSLLCFMNMKISKKLFRLTIFLSVLYLYLYCFYLANWFDLVFRSDFLARSDLLL